MKKISQYCQKCRAANEPGVKSCQSCGTPLMIVVNPSAVKHDDFSPPSYYEDHLLERVSLLELRLSQMSQSLSVALDIINEQNQTMREEHKLIRELHKTLGNIESGEKQLVKPLWDKIFRENSAVDFTPRIDEILTAGESQNSGMLELLIREAFIFVEQKDERRALAALKRAEPNAPKNVPLLLLFAEQLFYADKFEEAKQKLETAHELAPENEKVRLFLGALYADDLEFDGARKLLKFDVGDERFICVANLINGLMSGFENDWTRSAAHFKKALQSFEFAEIFYLIACALFQTKDYEKSLDAVDKALNIDPNFTDAYFMKGCLHGILGEPEAAKDAAEAVWKNTENGAQCMEFIGADKESVPQTALPFLHFEKKKRLLTGGAQRVRKLLRFFIFHILNK